MANTAPTELLARLDADRAYAAERALTDIDRLTAHLADLRASVEAWERNEAASTPAPYGNAFGNAASSVAAYTAAATAAAVAKKYGAQS